MGLRLTTAILAGVLALGGCTSSQPAADPPRTEQISYWEDVPATAENLYDLVVDNGIDLSPNDGSTTIYGRGYTIDGGRVNVHAIREYDGTELLMIILLEKQLVLVDSIGDSELNVGSLERVIRRINLPEVDEPLDLGNDLFEYLPDYKDLLKKLVMQSVRRDDY